MKRANGTLVVRGVGMVTAVGLTGRASAAAWRARLNRFQEVPFRHDGGSPVVGSPVPRVGEARQGLARQTAFLVEAIRDAVHDTGGALADGLPLVIGVGTRFAGQEDALLARFLEAIARELGLRFDPRRSAVLAHGAAAVVHAGARLREQVQRDSVPGGVVASTDSWLSIPGLRRLQDERRLKTENQPHGVIPGEGAAAVVLSAPKGGGAQPTLLGFGFGREEADTNPDAPATATGLAAAVRAAYADAGVGSRDVVFRLSDVAGERGAFRETALALARTIDEKHDDVPLWLPAESFGDMGAAAGPAMLGLGAIALRKGWAPGPLCLCQARGVPGERAVACLMLREA